MNEGSPDNAENKGEKEESYRKYKELLAAGSKFEESDKLDPERGPIVRLVRAVYIAAYKDSLTNGPLFGEFALFRKLFRDHFGPVETSRYRLYHIIVGSGPLGDADLFDAEGEWSIAAKMSDLAKEYHIDIEKV